MLAALTRRLDDREDIGRRDDWEKMSHVLEGEHDGGDDPEDRDQHGQNAQEATAGCEVHLQGVTRNTNTKRQLYKLLISTY